MKGYIVWMSLLTCLLLLAFSSSGVNRFTYQVPSMTQEVSFHVDDTAMHKLFATTYLPQTRIVVYKLQSEPLARYVLPRRVYQYVTVEAQQWNVQQAHLEFGIPKQWMQAHNVKEQQIQLFFYGESGWEALPTSPVQQDVQKQYFRSSITQLGNFAIGILEPFEIASVSVGEPEQQQNASVIPSVIPETLHEPDIQFPSGIEQEEPDTFFTYILYGLLFVFILGCMGMLYVGGSMLLSKKSKQTISSTTTIQEKRSHKPSLHEVLQKYSTKKDTDASHLKAHVSSHVNDVAHTADGKSSSQNATGDTTHHASKHMVKDFLQKLHLKSSSDKHNVSAHTQHQHEQADNNVATHAQHNVHTQQQEAVDSLAYQRHQHTNNNNTNDAHTNHIHNEHTTHTHIPEHTTGTQQPQHAWNKISAVVLKKFVAYQKQQGLDDEHIKEVLREHGFEESDIRHVFT